MSNNASFSLPLQKKKKNANGTGRKLFLSFSKIATKSHDEQLDNNNNTHKVLCF
jgi:hypothetical protein